MSVRSRVQEYGGGAWAVRDGIVLAVDFSTQQLWRLDGEPRALTPAVEDAGRAVVGDGDRPVARCLLRRARGPPRRGLGARRTSWSDCPSTPPSRASAPWSSRDAAVARRVLRADDSGDPALPDFVIDPVLSPDGRRLAWVQWSHPSMPWDDGAPCTVAGVDDRGDLHDRSTRRPAATAARRSNRCWVDDRRLAFLTDPDGWSVPHLVDVASDAGRRWSLVPARAASTATRRGCCELGR